MTYTVQHKRSGDINRRPLPNELEEGQVALNFNNDSPGMFFKTSSGLLVKAGPATISDTEPVASDLVNYQTFAVGELWIDSTNGVVSYWDGTEWVQTGAARVPTPSTPPADPEAGDLWYNSDSGVGGGRLYVWYVDGNTAQWVDASPTIIDGDYLKETGGTMTGTLNMGADILPTADSTYNLGSSSQRWANVHTGDLHLKNEGSQNDVDGTWGSYVIQEGEEELYLLNKRSGKKYKFLLEEVN